MHSTGFKYVIFAVTILITGCKKDISAFFVHTSADQRVEESLNYAGQIPQAIQVDTLNFKFAVFSDIHITKENDNLFDRFKQEAVQRNIDFFVVTGDLADNGLEEEMLLCREDLDNIGLPYYVTIGNHDLYQSHSWSDWKSIFGPATYSLVFSDFLKIIFLDSGSGTIGEKQFNWLKNELQKTPTLTMVATHYPIYEGVTPSIFRLSGTEERYKLISILNNYHVYAYLSGHYHAFEHHKLGQFHHFINGSMYPHKLDEGTHGFLLFTITNGQISWEKIEI